MEQKKETILEWYRKQQYYIDAPCGGQGKCGRCKVKFISNPPEPCGKDRRCLSEKELSEGFRLACAAEMTDETAFVLTGDIFTEEKWEQPDKRPDGKIQEGVQAFGVALDIGTTTIAMRLVDLQSGEAVVTLTEINRQRAYGADVLSRIQAANQGKLPELQKCIRRDIYEMLADIVNTTGISLEKIRKIVIVGNTTMCHLFLGYSCEGLGKAPFTPVNIALTKITPKELFGELEREELFPDEWDAEAVILPGISTFVGADIVAGLYFCDMDLKEEEALFLDVGTNGEMAVGSRKGFLVASTAAGPVFEGGNISCGMPAVRGAIAHIDEDGWKIIGEAEPSGICGSGLIDLAALMLREQSMDENGTFSEMYFENGYPVISGQEKGFAELVLTQADMRELQMGKGAIRAGIEILIQEQKPEQIYLAGGFGTAIDEAAACGIGLLPEAFMGKIISCGNTALEGAHKFLLDENGTVRVQEIVQKSREIVLADSTDFEEKYIQSMQFLV